MSVPTPVLVGATLFSDGSIQRTAAVTQSPVVLPVTQHSRVNAGTIGSALISLPITVNWATPFADNNYTVLASVTIGEPSSDGAVTSIICVASVQLQAGGVGVICTVANADSIPHSCVLNLYAIHD